MEQYKTCTKCRQTKPRTNEFFFRNNRSPDGLRPDCAECGRQRAREYARLNAEKNRQRANNWRLQNLEQKSQTNRYWYERNRQRIRAEWKLSYQIDPEKHKVASRRRRARERSVLSEPYTWLDVIALWGANCHICGLPIDLDCPRQMSKKGWEMGLQLDHVVPISKGGSDMLSNVKPAHGICNIRKKDN